MVEFQQSKTKENLARSFASECQEGARYQFMAKLALQEGYSYMSALIRTIAHNEMAHAQQFFNKLNELANHETQNININAGYPYKSSGELLESLLLESKNEINSGESIYPSFAQIARDEGYTDVAKLFDMVAEVELSHAQILEQLHSAMKSKTLYKSDTEKPFKCDSCGIVMTAKQAPKTCPLCKMDQGYYRIDITLNDYKDLNNYKNK